MAWAFALEASAFRQGSNHVTKWTIRQTANGIYSSELKNRNFDNAEGYRSNSIKTVPLLTIGAVFSELEMGTSAKAKTDF